MHDFSSYFTHLTTEAGYSAALSAFATAVPGEVLANGLSNPEGLLRSMATASAMPSWVTKLPASVQTYVSSVAQAEARIVSKEAKNPAPTNGVRVAGVMLAAGGAVVAML